MRSSILAFLITFSVSVYSQNQCEVKFYLDLTGKYEIGYEVDPTTTHLDSLIIEPNDIVSTDTNDFIFKLTEKAAALLRTQNLDFKVFTIVINDRPIIAGWFWGCDSSLGTTSYVAFNLNCGDEKRDEIRVDYSLPRRAYADKEIIKKTCQQSLSKHAP